MSRVLIVDDEEGLRDTFQQLLQLENHQVETAQNVDEALKKLDERPFDVVIADIIMPKKSGVELLRSISRVSPEIKVIMITGEPTVATAAEAVRAGAFDYLVKPISRDALWKVVAHAGVLKALEDENTRYKDHLESLVRERTAQLQDTLERFRKVIEGIIQAMATAIEMRDPYIAGHQRRVTGLAIAIAEQMNLPVTKIEGLRMAGLIHDLGKISVPAEILSKPGRLGEIAHEMIRTHPQVSYEILKNIEFLWPVAEIIHQHHERMDGTGYPQKLGGKEIMLEARILAVADVVEAISSHRPYRPALGLERALKEIEDHRGTHYDNDVVDACLTVFRKNRFRFDPQEADFMGPG